MSIVLKFDVFNFDCSITDLHTPIQELSRLVNVYSVPWEQRSEALKKLHNGIYVFNVNLFIFIIYFIDMLLK